MEYSTSMIQAGGNWRNLLIITSNTPVDWGTQTEIECPVSDEVKVIYSTDGLYKEAIKDGTYYYWFLFDSYRTLINGESEELAALRQANDALIEIITSHVESGALDISVLDHAVDAGAISLLQRNSLSQSLSGISKIK